MVISSKAEVEKCVVCFDMCENLFEKVVGFPSVKTLFPTCFSATPGACFNKLDGRPTGGLLFCYGQITWENDPTSGRTVRYR